MKFSSTCLTLLAPLALTTQIATAAEEETVLDEIIVTAQKRSQSIQDVPVAITAFTENMLAEIGANDLTDVSRRTPGLSFTSGSDMKLNDIGLRGVTTAGSSAGQDPAVGVYLDEVYLGVGVGANIDYFDVASVEVLRGPQGTLFGRNTIAGVIHVTSKRPSDEFEGAVSARYGNDVLRVNGTVSGPLVEGKLSARVTAYYDKRDGDIDNAFLGVKGDGSESYGVRGKLLFTPTEESELLLSFGYREANNNPRHVDTESYSPMGNPADGFGGAGSLFAAILLGSGLQLNEDGYDRTVYSEFESKEKLEAWDVALKGTISFTDMELVSITSYRTHEYYNIGDTEMSPLQWVYDGDPENVNRFSQELRLVSDNEGAFNWIAGLYYYNQHSQNESFVNIGDDLAAVLGAPLGLSTGSDAIMDVNSYAAFAHANYEITESLIVTAGARYTHEKKSITYSQFDPLGLLGGTIPEISNEDSWGAFTPSFSLQYHINDNSMAYGTISRGFKSGGYNDALGDADGISFNPEFLWNYEIGIKNKFLDNRVMINLALYHMNWTDIQIRQDNPGTPAVYDPVTFNAASATSQGIEVEFTVLASKNIEFGGNLTIKDAKYTEGLNLLGEPLGDFVGQSDYSYSAYAKYSVELENMGEFSLRADYLYTDDLLLALEDGFGIEGYQLLNARLSFLTDDESWEVSLWGENLTDTQYLNGATNFLNNPLVGQRHIMLARGRTYGIEARLKF